MKDKLITATTATLLLLSILACNVGGPSTTQNMYGLTPEEEAQRKDASLSKRIAQKTAELERTPAPKQYAEYVLAACEGHKQGLYTRQPEIAPKLDDVLAAGAFIEQNATYEAHAIRAYTGLYALCASEQELSERLLLESLAMKPGREAAEVLVIYYGSTGQYNRVGEVCGQTVPYLQRDDQFLLMETCKENLNTTSEANAFFWARQEDIDMWNAEQARRTEIERKRQEQEERERAAIVQQQREAWARAKAEREAQERQENKNDRAAGACVKQCEQRAYACVNDCYANSEECRFNCNQAYQACQEECYIRYDRPYTR